MKDFFVLDKQLCFAVYETAGEFTKLYTSALQPFGLTYPQYLVLLALWVKDGISAKELGERLNLGTGTLTPMITRMISNGWLRKERSKTDERKVHVYLEEKARQQKQAITQQVSETIQTCNIELEEYEQLMKQLGNLQKKLRERVPY
ncbi:MarR family winged helix-turn-helix transcriptional regulator [Cytobacillus sp. NCCP-133]|uniref:MarR family winged helix-turn-helix transcriptional regulator n=1 Tax=Cytobacillus sp. NCCP-133 TaxID=766848 RepID=UPI00222FD689|nr:MarR family transcriptional regulator [Cytobacillus sp. NCCP-133]GLB59901.1 MarR family transcriptional regulator [Cytobacillus sp. NCCP-133]